MGFFDLFKKKQKPEEIVEKEILISELMQEVNNIEKEKFSDFYRNFSDYNKRIVTLSKEIEKKVSALEKAKVNEKEVDERLLTRINSAKENMINKLKFLCKTKLFDGFDFSSFEEIKKSLEKIEAINLELNTVGSKYAGAVALIHKRDVNKINLLIKSLVSTFKELREYFEKNDKVSGFEGLFLKSKKIIDLSEFRKKIEKEIKTKEDEKDVEEKRIIEHKAKVQEIEKSENYQKVKEIEKEINFLISQLNNEKVILRNKFSDFSKALNKFEHDYPLNQDQEKLIEMYLSEPYDAMDTDPKFAINDILKELKEAVDSGKLGFDERIQNKSSSTISEFLEKELFNNSLEKKKQIRSDIEKRKKEMEKSGVFELNAENLKLKEAEKKLHDITTTIELQKELLHKNSDGIEKLKKEISELFLKFNINGKLFN